MDKEVINFVEEKFKLFKEETQKLLDANAELIINNKSEIDASIEQGKQRDKAIEVVEGKIIQYVNERQEVSKNDFKEEGVNK